MVLLNAAQLLADVMSKTLGTPRSKIFPMLWNNKGGYNGMIIGKEMAKVRSNAGKL